AAGLDAEAVAEEAWSGRSLDTLRAEHEEAVDRWKVFGGPTFIEGDDSAFVRLMERGRAADVDLVLDLLPQRGLNELKRTRIPRSSRRSSGSRQVREHLAPLGRARIPPGSVAALALRVLDVEVQRRRLVREQSELRPPRVWWRLHEHVDHCESREHPA